MPKIRKHLSFANVVACLALFVALGGASYAAVTLPKNSVGAKQLRKGAVKTNKIAAKAVKAGKLAKNSIATNRIRKGAVTGAKINAPTTPFGRIVETMGGGSEIAFEPETVYPLSPSSYTQPAGRADQFVGSVDVKFSAACTPPRTAAAFLVVDAADPKSPQAQNFAGYGVYVDTGSGEATRRIYFGPYPAGGSNYRDAPATDMSHTVSVWLVGAECNTGSGVTATGANVNVIGTR